MSQTDHASRRTGTTALVLIALAVAGGGGYYYWSKDRARALAAQQAAAPKPAAPVTIMTVKSSQYRVRLEGLGTVQPINTVAVRSRVDGQIETVFFKEGEMVKQGDLLLRIDPRPFRAALDQSQAKLAQDEATLKNAQLDLQRYSTLADKQFASRKQLDTQAAAVASGTALTQADQAAVDNAKVQLGYTEIRSPLTGRIGFRQVDAGNIVQANSTQALLSIVQMDPINVLYTLPEGNLATVEQALAQGPVPVIATVVGKRVTPTVTGQVAVVNNQVDQASGTVQIKAEFDNKGMQLWPGQSVTTKTQVAVLDNVIVIPSNLIQHGPDGLFVWRVDDTNVALPDKIQVSEQDNENSVVSSGLSVGDKIVTSGQLRLRKGIKVEVRDAADQQARLDAGAAAPDAGKPDAAK